jgi:hypothetical protein
MKRIKICNSRGLAKSTNPDNALAPLKMIYVVDMELHP